jgi:uncharacterized protein YqjF (DUF2071 family)
VSGVFLTAEWRYLAMLNFAVEPELLADRVPPGTTLDAWNGTTYVSLVGFMFLRTRVLGVPVPFHVNFEELNLRFYVRREAAGESRRGVVFVKEIVPRFAIATVARVVYNENYVAMPMRHGLDVGGAERGSAEYGWRHRGRWNRLRVETEGPPRPLEPGSEAEFITEHYWGYAAQKGGGTMEYRVEHPPWRVWNATGHALDCDAASIYGERFGPALAAAPVSAFLAEGSPIAVRRGQRLSSRSEPIA